MNPHRDTAEGICSGNEIQVKDARIHGRSCSTRDDVRHGIDGGEDIERPDLNMATTRSVCGIYGGKDNQTEGRQPQNRNGAKNDGSAIHAVSEHSTPGASKKHGDQCHSTHQANEECVVGDVEDLQTHGHDGHLRADAGERGTNPKPGEGRRCAKWGEVNESAFGFTHELILPPGLTSSPPTC